MTCTKHNIPDNNQDGLDIKSCSKCEGKGFTTIGFIETAKSQHLLEFSRANKAKANLGKICEPCNGTGLGEKVKKIWYEDWWKCDGTGEVYWGVCWACGGRKKRAFKTSPEVRAKRRETARKKREEKAVLRLEKELARQREITGGLTFAEKREEREAQWAEEKAKAQDVPTGTVNISGEVIKVALQETRFGQVAKMTVKDHQNGFVVWGSVPTIFNEEGKLLTVGKGDHITFTASVTPSEKDAKFGFFKRPRKAVISQVSN